MKNLFLIFIIVIMILSWGVTISNSVTVTQEYDAHIKKAEELVKKQLYPSAIEEYHKVLKVAPGDYNVQILIARTYAKMDKQNNAVDIYESLISSSPENKYAYIEMANLYIDNNKLDDAIITLKDGLAFADDRTRIQEIYNSLRGKYYLTHTTFDEMSSFVNNVAVVKEGDKYGFKDMSDDIDLPLIYDNASNFGIDSDCAPVFSDNSWFYIDKQGYKKLVSDKKFEYLGIFSQGVAPAKLEGKCGFVNNSMKVSRFDWDYTGTFFNSLAAVKKGNRWALLDMKFSEIGNYAWDDIKVDENGVCFYGNVAIVKKGGKYTLVDGKGAFISDSQFDDAKAFLSKEPAAVMKDGKWGFADTAGKIVIKPAYEDANSFTNGYAAVKQNGKWGFIGPKGEMLISPEFEYAKPVSETGAAPVKVGNKWKIMQLYILKK